MPENGSSNLEMAECYLTCSRWFVGFVGHQDERSCLDQWKCCIYSSLSNRYCSWQVTAAKHASKRCRVTVLQPEHRWPALLMLVVALRKCCFSFWSSASSSGCLLLGHFHNPSEIIKMFELRNSCDIVWWQVMTVLGYKDLFDWFLKSRVQNYQLHPKIPAYTCNVMSPMQYSSDSSTALLLQTNTAEHNTQLLLKK